MSFFKNKYLLPQFGRVKWIINFISESEWEARRERMKTKIKMENIQRKEEIIL